MLNEKKIYAEPSGLMDSEGKYYEGYNRIQIYQKPIKSISEIKGLEKIENLIELCICVTKLE